MLNISTTTIEEFRKFQSDEYTTEDKLISYITGKAAPTKFMELGTAFHDILQNPQKRFIDHLQSDDGKTCFKSRNGIVFPYEVFTKPPKNNPESESLYERVDYEFPFEVKTSKIYSVFNEEIEVITKVDQLIGLAVKELKSSWTGFDYDKYLKSVQWKIYHDVFEAEKVEYLVAELSDLKDGIVLKDIHEFSFTSYPGMMDSVHTLLEDFVEYIHNRGLEQYFLPKQQKVA